MEKQINRDILKYTESVYFGLSLRQFVCSVIAVAAAVGIFLLLQPKVGTEMVSWLCILAALPPAAMGFFTYHGMTAEQAFFAWLKSEIIEPRQLVASTQNNLYESACSEMLQAYRKEERNHVEIRTDDLKCPEGEVPCAEAGAGYDPDSADVG